MRPNLQVGDRAQCLSERLVDREQAAAIVRARLTLDVVEEANIQSRQTLDERHAWRLEHRAFGATERSRWILRNLVGDSTTWGTCCSLAGNRQAWLLREDSSAQGMLDFVEAS